MTSAIIVDDDHNIVKVFEQYLRLNNIDVLGHCYDGKEAVTLYEKLKPDIVGIPVNICSKINGTASQNGVVIGNDLYQLAKDSDDYHYNQIKAYSIGLKQLYPIYSVQRKK